MTRTTIGFRLRREPNIRSIALREIQNLRALRKRDAFVSIIDCGRFVE